MDWLLAGCPPLETRTLEHLLVLFLPHSFAALFNQGTHEVHEPSKRREGETKPTGYCEIRSPRSARVLSERAEPVPCVNPIGGRPIGRTPDFGSGNGGSSPPPRARSSKKLPPSQHDDEPDEVECNEPDEEALLHTTSDRRDAASHTEKRKRQ